MALPFDKCVGWWKLQADGIKEIGSDLVAIGTPDHSHDGKFNKGLYGATATNHIYRTVINPMSTPGKGIIELWLKPDYAMVAGVQSGGLGWAGIVSYWADDNNVFMMQMTDTGNGNVIYFVVGGVWFYWTVADFQFSWSAGDDVHLMFVVDTAGIDGGANTFRVYQDGVLKLSSDTAGLTFPANGYIYFGDMVGYGRPLYAVLDNPKLSEDDSSQTLIDAIIANKDNEGWPVSGIRMRNKFNKIQGRFNI